MLVKILAAIGAMTVIALIMLYIYIISKCIDEADDNFENEMRKNDQTSSCFNCEFDDCSQCN